MAMPTEGFELTKGAVKGFTRDDIEGAVTREFCENLRDAYVHPARRVLKLR